MVTLVLQISIANVAVETSSEATMPYGVPTPGMHILKQMERVSVEDLFSTSFGLLPVNII